MSILQYWPFKNSAPRKTQVDVLEWIEKLPAHIKYIIAEVPVGGGKSPIALNASGFFAGGKGNSIILTPQKVLQKQYEDSFSDDLIYSMYGASNYSCATKNTNCEVGALIKPKCANCPCADSRKAAANTPNLVLNYRLGLLLFMAGSKIVQNKSLVVFDECHTLESQLTDFSSIYISERSCKKYGVLYKKPISIEEVWYFIDKVYLPRLQEYRFELQEDVDEIINKYQSIFGGGKSTAKPTKDEINKIRELQELEPYINRLTAVKDMDVDLIKEKYVLTYEPASYRLKQLFADEVFNEIVDPMAERILFMSSTILDYKSFCSDLGIDVDKAAFISMDSEFNVDNRPVYYMPVAKMSYGWDSEERKSDRDAMETAIQDIISGFHPSDSGVIHTGSFAVSKWLVKALDKKISHKIFHHNSTEDDPISRDATIEQFLACKEPAVLISPSVTEGLDLKDDLGRFSIICKVPYPFLGDAWIKRRMELSGKWYAKQAAIGIIQASGRVVRNNKDKGTTYILDSSFAMLKNMNKDLFPKWWLSSYQKV